MYAYPNGYFYNPFSINPNMGASQNVENRPNDVNQQHRPENSRMYSQQNFENPMLRPSYMMPQNFHQQMIYIERQLSHLISLIEENNRLLQSLQQQQRVVTSGGGAVIVRM